MTIEPTFYRMFGLWLHADAIDMRDYPGLLSLADVFADVSYGELKDPAAVIQSLKEHLEHPSHEVTQSLIDASEVAWTRNERYQQALRDVLTTIVRKFEEVDAIVRSRSAKN